MLRGDVWVSTGACFSLTHYPSVPGLLPNVPSSRAYRNGFTAALMPKDLRLAEQAGLESGQPLQVRQLAAALFACSAARAMVISTTRPLCR